MSSPEFTVAARDLDAAGREFRFRIRSAWIRGALESTDVRSSGADGELDVRLSKSGTDVLLRGTVRADLVVPCARCLEPTRVVVQEPLSALFVVRGAVSGVGRRGRSDDGERDRAADEADLTPYDGETVILDDLVRDELLLGVPMIPLCSESCAGIRPQSASPEAEPAVDPRLSPLLRLRKT